MGKYSPSRPRNLVLVSHFARLLLSRYDSNHGGFHDHHPPASTVELHRYAERQRKIFGAMPSLNSEQYRTFEPSCLLAYKVGDQGRLLLIAGHRPQPAKNDARDPIKHTRMAHLHQHPINPVSFFARVLEE